jgi:hypothetical protein
MRWRAAWRTVLAAAVFGVGLAGCAAIPLAVVAGSLLEAGGGMIVKTGTEYTASGTAVRTFNVPAGQVHAGVLEAFSRAQIMVVRDEASPKRHRVKGLMQGRSVYVDILPLTPVLTALTLDVKRNVIASDKATASELLAQVERVVNDAMVAGAAHEQRPACEPVVRAAKRRR